MAAGLSGLAATASPEYVAYAGILALMAALFLFLARLIKLGFLADFLSRTVLIGFLMSFTDFDIYAIADPSTWLAY